MFHEDRSEVTGEIKRDEFQELPFSLRSFYHEKGDKLMNSCYSEVVPLEKSFGISLEIKDVQIPPIIFSKDVDDIRISTTPRYGKIFFDRDYDEQGFPLTTYDGIKGLEKYCIFVKQGVPIYVFDNHSHALFAWQEALEAGYLEQGNTVLIHLDDHTDLRESQNSFIPKSRNQVKEAIVEGEVDIADFIDPALASRLVQEVIFIHSVSDLDFNTINGKELATTGEEGRVIAKYRNEGRFVDRTQSVLQNPEFLLRMVQDLKSLGKKIILDVDFDLFTSERAHSLLPILPHIAQHADVVTCATSPSYIQQNIAIELVKKFIQDI